MVSFRRGPLLTAVGTLRATSASPTSVESVRHDWQCLLEPDAGGMALAT